MYMKIDIGYGNVCKAGFVGIDYAKYNSDVKYVVNLNKSKLPFKDNSIDEAYCSHVLEHLDNPMEMVSEVHRVLKKGSKFIIKVPYFANTASHKPNHKNYWNLGCIDYFNGDYHEAYPKWSKVNFGHRWVQGLIYKPFEIIFDFLIKLSPITYEKRFAYLFPFFELIIELEK